MEKQHKPQIRPTPTPDKKLTQLKPQSSSTPSGVGHAMMVVFVVFAEVVPTMTISEVEITFKLLEVVVRKVLVAAEMAIVVVFVLVVVDVTLVVVVVVVLVLFVLDVVVVDKQSANVSSPETHVVMPPSSKLPLHELMHEAPEGKMKGQLLPATEPT